VQSLIEARDERRLTALQQHYQKVALLVRIKPESNAFYINLIYDPRQVSGKS